MATTFDASKDEIAQLCAHFATNRDGYRAPGVKEAHVRQSLIDPFFKALGWDVANEKRVAPQYREVVPEDSLDIEGHQKAPDYAFRVGSQPRFFAEAKRCGIDISGDPAPAYQLRRYGFSAHVPLSILTDFEELGVYDCSLRPRPADRASRARTIYLRSEEYPDRWRELWDIFSREAVWSGAFDRYALSGRKRGTSEVDAELLKDIEAWREELARNLALRNPGLSLEDLNRAVQLTIDRIVFLRMAEDRGLEREERLLDLCNRPGIYRRFMEELCREAEEKYDSGLFYFKPEPGLTEDPDRITPRLVVDDKVFKPILQSLYFAHGSPYHFGVLPVEILGTVYERFLGKVIRLTAQHRAKVEAKPEVRKAGGVYYTPAYIVDYIVAETVGKQIEGRSPAELAGRKRRAPPFRVLDMACGSGSFLLGAYRCLLDHCLKWYLEHDPQSFRKVVRQDPKTGEWRLRIPEKKRILRAHIFGVDIDPQAVEVSKLSLLLKVLEGENDRSVGEQMQLFQERALPNLSANIRCGNSLVGPDYFTDRLIPDPEELRRVNPLDWAREFPDAMAAGGFDCVIGNPPYIRIQTMREWAPLEAEIYRERFRAARAGNYDIYVVFVERGLQILKPDGRLGFICPHKFFNARYGQELRAIIADGQHLAHVVHFGDQQVFEGATTYTCLLFLAKSGRHECAFLKVDDITSWRLTGAAIEGIVPASTVHATPWSFRVGGNAVLFRRLSEMPVKLGAVAHLFVGLQTDADDVFILESLAQEEDRVLCASRATGRQHWFEADHLKPLLKGSLNIRRYHLSDLSKRLIFPYTTRDGESVLLNAAEYRGRFPLTWAYLEENRQRLAARNRGRMGGQWYGYVYKKNHLRFGLPKLLVPAIATGSCFAIDMEGLYYFVGSGGGGGGAYGILPQPVPGLSSAYLLGLLNSSLLSAYLRSISTPFRGGYIALNRQYVEQLPIRTLDLRDRNERARQEKMVRLVAAILELHRRLGAADSAAKSEVLQRQIAATDAEIDRLVYELYGLTDEEIAIVEGKAS
ncbi:MAG: Eco57I restriction-modification methylase domain-containing protein [Deltaproteobacteria bacterium]|nr:Eco57I restriction-modification methylase domain-containing protein [Deltaproteobacteria bacterium]